MASFGCNPSVVKEDVWYIIPFDVVEDNSSVNLTPRKGINSRDIWRDGICCAGARRKAQALR
jgi:hypothetical protein